MQHLHHWTFEMHKDPLNHIVRCATCYLGASAGGDYLMFTQVVASIINDLQSENARLTRILQEIQSGRGES